MIYDGYMETPVYKVQCYTFDIAKELAGNVTANVTRGEAASRPPYCLRIVKKYRTPAQQNFRNKVAAEIRKRRTK